MFRRAAALMVAVLVLGGCSTQSPTPTPGDVATNPATPTTAPSPTPVDVASLFLPQIVAMTKGSLDVNGTLTVGSQSGTVAGTISYIGADSDQLLVVTFGASASKTESIHVAGHGYTKTGDGPWFEDTKPPSAGKDLTSVLAGLTSLTDAGTETRQGVLVHRLELPAGTVIDPAVFGLTNASQKDPSVSLVFYADAAGKPISMVVDAKWSQVSGTSTIPAAMRFELHFGSSTPDVHAPSNVFTRFSSKRFHYSMAHPLDWQVSTSDKVDRFASPGEPFILLDRFAVSGGYILNDAAKDQIASIKSSGATFVSNQPITVGGLPARLLTFRVKVSGASDVLYAIVSLRSGFAYEVFWFSPKGHEAADLALLRAMVGTYAFTP